MKSLAKVLVSLLALGLAGASLVRAQDPVTPPPADNSAKKAGKRVQQTAEARLKQLDDALKLTDDQKTKIKEIWAKEATGARDMTREQRAAAMKSAHDAVRAILTPDQQTKFDAMPAENRPMRAGKGKNKNP
jgi:Spy/CpxP family protein refolding chaperone